MTDKPIDLNERRAIHDTAAELCRLAFHEELPGGRPIEEALDAFEGAVDEIATQVRERYPAATDRMIWFAFGVAMGRIQGASEFASEIRAKMLKGKTPPR